MNEINKKIGSGIHSNLNENLRTLERVCSCSFASLRKKDLAEAAINSGAELIGEKKLLIKYFGGKIAVDAGSEKIYYPEGQKDIMGPGNPGRVDVFSSSIILHYLNNADGTNLSGKWIAYRELRDGLFYFRTIPGVLKSLVKKFESSSGDLIKIIEKNGGKKSPDFINGAIIYPFPYFPILIILEEKSEEFEAAVRVLFDSNSCHYIKTDIIKMVLVYMAGLLTS